MENNRITWQVFTFARIALAFLSGILLQNFLSNVFYYTIPLTFIVLLINFYKDYYKDDISYSFYRGYYIITIFLLLGHIRADISNPLLDNRHYSHYTEANSFFVGVVTDEIITRVSHKAEIDLKYLCNDTTCIKVKSPALVYFKFSDNKAKSYRPGDMIVVKGKLETVNKSMNPHTFDFKAYLFNRGVTHQTFIKDSSSHFLLKTQQLSIINQIAMNSRKWCLDVFNKYIKDKDRFAVTSALVLGYRNNISDDIYKAFSDSGSVHILAVSGMHLALLAAALVFIFNKIKLKSKNLRLALYLLVLWFFTFLTGAAPAVVRAAVMATFVLYARERKINYSIYNILSICAFMMLLYDPNLLYQASFQFSFVAVLSLMYFQKHLSDLFTFDYRILNYLWEYITAAIAAQILVLPLTLYFFYKFPTYFILSGLLPVIISNIALYVGIIILVFEAIGLSFFNELLFSKVINYLIEWFIASVDWIKDLPFSCIDGITLTMFEFILFALTLITLMYVVFKKSNNSIILCLSFFMVMIVSVAQRLYTATDQSKVFVYDVNKGGFIDFIDGKTTYSLTFSEIPETQSNFVFLNNRYFHFIKEEKKIDINSNFQDKRLRKIGNVLQFKSQNFFIHHSDVLESIPPLTNYLIVMNNASVFKRADIPKNTIVILDKSLKYNNLKKWMELLEEEGYFYYNIRQKGCVEIRI